MIDHIGSKPAPGRLRLIQAFVNSRDCETGRDDFGTPALLGEWLLAHGLLADGAALGSADLEAARAGREALRSMLLANNGAPADKAALAVAESLTRRACLTLRFGDDGSAALTPQASGIDRALGTLFAIAFEAMLDGTWARFKACPEGTCRFAFFDHSRNHSGTWCSMSSCGNREKARQYRGRRRASEGVELPAKPV
jgi:predicted RNA-binding Zn ribbon-like protein